MDLPPIVNTIIALLGSAASVAGLGWWLSGRFRSIETAQRKMLDTHEDKDQERHEENLERFSQIGIALAVLGYKKPGKP
jgi:hypothetical protein